MSKTDYILSSIYGHKKSQLLLMAIVSAIIIFISMAPIAVFAQEVGNQALELWDMDNPETMENSPAWLQYWLMIMMASFALGLLFVWKRIEARWVVGGFIAGLLASSLVTPALGLMNLSGLVALVHLIFWSPALYMLLKNRPFMTERSFYGVWSALITAVIIFSFIFDIRDAAIYLDYMLGMNMLS